MSSQAEQLQQTMSFFKLDDSGHLHASAAPARNGPGRHHTTGKMPKFVRAATMTHATDNEVDEAKFTKF